MNAFVSLMYHNVVARAQRFPSLSPSVTSYFVDQHAFAEHLDEIAMRCHCLRLRDVRNLLCERKSLAAPQSLPGVQITFDDGWQGSTDLAGPLLESHGFEGLLFVTTGLIGKPDFVSTHDLRSLPRSVFQIGSHGHTHRLLNQLSEAEITAELATSKKILEDTLGLAIDSLSLPGGAGNSRVLQIAREVGYRLIFTSEAHVNSRLTNPSHIGRISVRKTTRVEDIRRFVTHRIGSSKLRHNCLRFAKQILGQQRYERWRRQLLGESAEQLDMVALVTNSREAARFEREVALEMTS